MSAFPLFVPMSEESALDNTNNRSTHSSQVSLHGVNFQGQTLTADMTIASSPSIPLVIGLSAFWTIWTIDISFGIELGEDMEPYNLDPNPSFSLMDHHGQYSQDALVQPNKKKKLASEERLKRRYVWSICYFG